MLSVFFFPFYCFMVMDVQDDDRKRVEKSIISVNSLVSEDRSIWLEKIYKQAVSYDTTVLSLI